ncbi:MAG TPA: mechanosensitive ion channel [candidate division Zixibacteria bacterium]|nr:mechanosensitive ion channel [candidate division Zixibacteria bacterium]
MLEILEKLGTQIGLTGTYLEMFTVAVLIAVIILAAYIANIAVKRIILQVVALFVKQSKTKWDDILLEKKFFSRLAHIAPALVFYFSAPFIPELSSFIERMSVVYMLFSLVLVAYSFLDSLVAIYQSYEVSRQRPLNGYVQIVKILVTLMLVIVIISTLMGKSPLLILGGLGAMTAVLLLIFKDTILGLVASVQISMGKMVQVGDWIEMPKYGADGDVLDISLYTIKVQNWDKTITTIPSYSLISDSFKNWRGMSESGGRRIKRSIFLDMTSIRFLNEADLNEYHKFQMIEPYLKQKQKEIEDYNNSHNIDNSALINGRHLTNIGTFRAYIAAYLKQHPNIHDKMTFLIRQLAPTDHGLPIEMYVFSNDQDWIRYEAIQSDIMDHLLAVIPLFDLRVYQNPTGHDFKQMLRQ